VLAFNVSHRRLLVWTLVVGTHVFVIFLLSRERTAMSMADKPVVNEALLFVELPAVAVENAIPAPMALKSTGFGSRAKPIRPSAESAPVAPETPAGSSVDWSAAAARAAGHAVAGERATAPRQFGISPISPYRECQRKKLKEWRPEDKAGFAGGLPYVRVSKHCIVGLPFFACAIGALPPPKSDLFEDMESNKQGSVPGDDDCVAVGTPAAPPPHSGTAPHE
jgi:hypothetical protein